MVKSPKQPLRPGPEELRQLRPGSAQVSLALLRQRTSRSVAQCRKGQRVCTLVP